MIASMANYFFDTSSFLKYYIEENGSDTVQALVEDPDGGFLVILDLTILEARSAIRRLEREGNLSSERANDIIRQIEFDSTTIYSVQQIATSMRESKQILDRHALRTLDALQLAGYLIARQGIPSPLIFVCADNRLLDAAEQEGLDTLNPLDPS